MVYYYDYYYGYGYPRRPPSVFDGLSLRPLPYPVLLILVVVSIFLGMKFYFAAEEAAETADFNINWMLLITPILLIFAVRVLSSIQDRRWWSYGGCPGPARCGCFECRARVPVYRPW